MLREIQGRSTDFVVAADGTVLHGLALIYILRDLPGVKQFKIVQENLQHTRMLVVSDGSFDPGLVPGIQSQARARLGPEVVVDVEIVESIAPERSGKYRYVVSRVQPPPVQERAHA
jgi:phenylacetate-CoA ligase